MLMLSRRHQNTDSAVVGCHVSIWLLCVTMACLLSSSCQSSKIRLAHQMSPAAVQHLHDWRSRIGSFVKSGHTLSEAASSALVFCQQGRTFSEAAGSATVFCQSGNTFSEAAGPALVFSVKWWGESSMEPLPRQKVMSPIPTWQNCIKSSRCVESVV